MTDAIGTLERLAARATAYVQGAASRVEACASGMRIVATSPDGDAEFAAGTPMELLSRITDGSFRNWLVALRDR